jgi:hypothetical protein
MREKKNAYSFSVRKSGRILLGRLKRECGRIILRWILDKLDGVVWTGFIWLRIMTSGGL